MYEFLWMRVLLRKNDKICVRCMYVRCLCNVRGFRHSVLPLGRPICERVGAPLIIMLNNLHAANLLLGTIVHGTFHKR